MISRRFFESYIPWLWVVVLMALFSVGCAHSRAEDTRLNRELAAENQVTTGSELRTESRQVIETAPGLTDSQRTQLLDLRHNTRAKITADAQESLKLRSLLIQDMLASNYDEPEVEAIKSKMKKVEDDRLAAIFDAVKNANLILGRAVAKNPSVIHDLLEEMPGDAKSVEHEK